MIITEICIESFGKLKDYRIKLKPGLNSFLYENGYGKTTLTYFIKAMLYGLEQTTKQSLFENERRRFMPWEGGAFGGFMCFSVRGRSYRVERRFGSKLSEDSFALYDLKTALPSTDYSERLGEELFGIDADGFERTVFISEKLLGGENKNPSVAAKLSDLSGVEGDLGSFDDAVNSIEKQIKLYKKKGGGGLLRDTERLIRDIEKEQKEIDKAKELASRAEADIESLEEQRRVLLSKKALVEREREAALSVREARIHRERLSEMYAQIADRRRELEELMRFFEKKLPEDEETYYAQDNYLRYQRAKETLADNDGDTSARAVVNFIGGDEGYERALALKRARGELEEQRRLRAEAAIVTENAHEKSKFPVYMLAGAVAAALISILMAFVYPAALIVTLPVFIAALALSVLIGAKEKRAALDAERERREAVARAEAKYAAKHSEYLELLGGFSFDEELSEGERLTHIEQCAASYKIAKQTLISRDRRRTDAMREAELAGKRAEEFLSLFRTETDRPFDEIRAKRAQYDRSRRALEELELGAKRYAEQNRLDIPVDESLSDMAQIAERAAGIDGQILENERELTQKRTVIDSYQKERVRAEELGDRRDEQEARLAAMQEKHDILVKTRELLSAAKDRLSEKYIGPTNESFRKYMNLIDPALTDISVDTAFNLTRTDKGATRIQDSYSKGTRDAMTLALRLALGDSLYEGELPPMIFDDPYSSLDDTRTKRAREALKLLADERQILYFTCSGSREIK